MTIDEIFEQIKISEKIIILTHENPDGDAIGSSLAMKLALNKIGKQADVYIPEFSKVFEFLPGANEIIKVPKTENYDLVIGLDCANLKRLKGGERYFDLAKSRINIDHHGSNTMYADYNFVDPVSPACCQILIGLFDYFGIEIDIELGTCILAGIITDTGGFRHSGTNKETFEFTAWLLEKGVKVSELYRKVLQTKTKATFDLTKVVVDRMEFLENGKIAFTYITLKDKEKANAQVGDHEGLVDIGIDIEGVEVSIFAREESENEYKYSLRSKEYVNVSDVCLMHNGGGHPRAAGCTINGELEQGKEKLISEIKKLL